MRALFTCVPGFGHFHPLVPLARALADAGHQVAFSTVERFCRRVVEPAGFLALPAGMPPLQVDEETRRRPEVAALGPGDVWRFGAAMFAGVAAPAKVPELVEVIERWSPDVVVHDPIDFAAPVAAARAGLPYASHSFGGLQPMQFWQLSGEVIGPTWEEWEVEPGPLGGMFRYLYLDICPPRLQTTDIEQVEVVHPLRPVPFDVLGGNEELPPWLEALPPGPTVYVTFGTLFNHTPGLFETVLAALGDDPVQVIVTVGPDRDPDELGRPPGNVHVERYLPQSLVFPRCDAVVSHGGSGTTLAALAYGLPHLVVPLGANQHWNAERVVAVGAGRSLPHDELSPEALVREVRALLDEPRHRAAAAVLQHEIQAMPSPQDRVGLLERLAADRQPMVARP